MRAVEKRIEFAMKPDPRDWEPEGAIEIPPPPAEKIPPDFREHAKIMLDLMALAFQTDSTRVLSFMFANDVSGRNFSFLEGVSGGHHDMSHHQKDPEKLKAYQIINQWHVEQYAYLLRKLRDTKEGDSNVLDQSMILLGAGIRDGDRHDPHNLPMVLAGKAGGRIATGQHLVYENDSPLSNLYLCMLDAFGTPVERFGDSTGKLAGVLA